MARSKKDKGIVLDAPLAFQIIEWKDFIVKAANMQFGGIKLTPNDSDTDYHVEYAIGIDDAGTSVQFTDEHKRLIEGPDPNVVPIATGTDG